MPDLCTVTGNVFDGNGVAKVSAYLKVTPLGATGLLLHKAFFPVLSTAGGAVSFVVIQNVQYKIEGENILGLSGSGLTVTIPASSSVTLESLIASSLVPSTGLTIKQGGVSFASLVGTFNFNADDFTLTNSPTGQLNISIAAESLVNPMSAVGDSLYGGVSGAATRLAGNTTTTRKFLRQTGDGAASAAPAWDTLQASDLPTGIDAAKIAGGLVSNAEYDFLNGVTDSIQTQLNTKAATTYVDSAIASLVAASPSTLDTLNEIAAALGNDPNLSATLTASIGTKAAKASNLSDLSDASAARTNLGLAIGTNVQAFNQNLADIAGLADPNTDRLLFWDDSASAHKYLTLGDNLSITDTTLNAAGGGGTPGGVSGDLQYNNAGAFAGSLLKQGTNKIEQRNGANSQSLSVFNDYGADDNYNKILINTFSNGGAFLFIGQGAKRIDSANFYVGNSNPGGWLYLQAGGTNAFGYDPATGNHVALGNSFHVDAGVKRVSTQFDKTSNTTLADITGLSAPVFSGRTFNFRAVLYTTSNASGGVKVAMGGTATASAIIYEADVIESGVLKVPGASRANALGGTVANITAVTVAKIIIEGTITVSGSGTLTVQFAQNASDGNASSVLVGSYLRVSENP